MMEVRLVANRLRTLLRPLRRLGGARARPLSPEELRAELPRYGKWSYPFELPGGIVTPLMVDWLAESHATRSRMVFSRLDELYRDRWPQIDCLDIACNEGYYGMEVSRRGARRVVSFDARAVNIEKAEFIKRQLGLSRISFQQLDLLQLTPERFGAFDLTLCLGLLYHLDNPMDAIRRVRAVTKELCVIDTQVLHKSAPVVTAWITDDNLIETENVIGIIKEPDAMVNPSAAVTPLTFIMNEPALMTMLQQAGFRDIERVPPFEGCFQPYATGDRLVLLARV
jgi:2-polyprenyl-3-methyl-5-hydroxy-6-metoxy-1,4-benzoquinol methylase